MPATLPDFGQETATLPEFGNELPDFGNDSLPSFDAEPAPESLEDSLASFNRLHPRPAAPRPSLEPELPPQPQPQPVLEPPQLRPYQKTVPQTWEQMHEGVGGPVLDATQKRLLDAKRAYGALDSSDEEFYKDHPQFKPLTATDMPMPRMSKGEVAAILPEWLAGPVAGAQQGIADFVDFATSPAGLATAVTGGVAGAATEAGAGAGAIVNQAMATGFAVDMAKDMPEQFDSILQSIRSGDSAAATRGMLAAGAALLMVGHAAKANVPHGTPEALKSAREGTAIVPPTEMGSPPTVKPLESAGNVKPEAKATPLSTADLESSVQDMIEEMTKRQIIKPKPEVPEGVQLPVFDKSEETVRPQAQPLTPNKPTVGETTPVVPAPLRVTQDLSESTPIRIAQELGVRFDGEHDYGFGEPSWSFTREIDGMSFNVPVNATPEQIKGAFAARKAQFEAQVPSETQLQKLPDRTQRMWGKEDWRNFKKIIEQSIRKNADEARGQAMLDELEEQRRSPRDVVKDFWAGTFGRLPERTQRMFQQYYRGINGGYEPGDEIGTNADGTGYVAKSWEDTWQDVPQKVEHLEGEERGLIALMETANRNFPEAKALPVSETPAELQRQLAEETSLREVEEQAIKDRDEIAAGQERRRQRASAEAQEALNKVRFPKEETVSGSAKWAERFRKMADTIESKLEDERRPLSQNPTPKRNREYRSRLHDAENHERTAKALRALAEAHETGNVPPELTGLRTKDDVARLVNKGLKEGGYYDVIPDPEYRDKSLRGKAMQALIVARRESPEQKTERLKREKENEIRQLEDKVRFSNLPGFFPTPKTLAEQVVRRADIQPGQSVLEPSAGKGDLADVVREQHPDVKITTLERMHTLREILKAKGYDVAGDDALTHQGQYDRIVMNPPFEKGQDIEHVRKAYDNLKPGGKLVAIMSEGPFSRNDSRSRMFRQWIEKRWSEDIQLGSGAFQGKEAFRQTGVASRIVVIEKPVSVEPEPSQAKVETPAQAVAEIKAEVSEVARTEGQRPAKEIKSELVQRLEKAIEEAPNKAPKVLEAETDLARVREWRQKDFGRLRDFNRSRQSRLMREEAANLFKKYFGKASDESAMLMQLADKIAELRDAENAKVGKTTIDIPGDGSFTVPNTKENLSEILRRAKAIATTTTSKTFSESKPSRAEGQQWMKEAEVQPSIGAGIKKALERKGEAGAVSLPSAKELKEKLGELPEHAQAVFKWAGKQRERAIARSRRRGSYNLIAANKDSADNRGQIVAKQAANIVRHELNRAFGSPIEEQNPLREHALTFVIEASGDKASLGEMRYKIEHAPEAPPLWKHRAVKAIDFAEANWEKLSPVADGYKQLTDAENAYENFHGVQTLYRQGGYVFHLQDVDESFGIPSTGTPGGGGAPQPFRHIRDHPTYADSIAAGVTPESLSAVDLLQRRIALGQRLVNYGEWVESMRPMVDPATKLAVIENPIERTRADGTQDTTAPPGYKLVEFGGKQVALHNGYAGLFGDLTNISWMQGTEFRKNVMQSIGLAKHTALLFDTYHMGRLAFWNAVTRMGLPRYGRGVTLLDNTTVELKRMVERGEIPKEWGDKLVEDKRTLMRMVRAGMNVGNIGDNLYTDFLQKIPGIGHFNKWLFNAYQRGAMSEVALIERRRVDSTHPELSEEAKDRLVAKDVNTRFGNLQSQSWIKSKTGQDLARIIFLAPQWNESLIRAELGAVARTTGAIAKGRPKQIGMLARGIGMAMLGTFIGNQLINFATRGKPTWENEEEGFGAKISAYIPDVSGGPGVFLNPMSLPAEITNLIFRNAERHNWNFADAMMDFAKGRFSSLSRGVWTFATGETPMGQKIEGQRFKEALGEAVPAPISGGAVYRLGKQLVTGEHQEKYPGQFERSILQSAGVKTEAVPGPEKRIRDLAVRFNREHRVKEDAGYHEGAFTPLVRAVRLENMTEAKAALKELLEMDKSNGIRMTAADVTKHFRSWSESPFTHAKAREAQFMQTLSPAQRTVYERARNERRAVAAKVQTLLSR